jgi:apolipoprotein N-acyltransferase
MTGLSFLRAARLPAALALLAAGFPPASVPAVGLVALVPLLAISGDHGLGRWRRAAGILLVCAAIGLWKFGWVAGSLISAIGAPAAVAWTVVAAYVLGVSAAYTTVFMLPAQLPAPARIPAQCVLLAGVTIAIPWPLPVSFAHGVLDLPALPRLAAIGGVAAVDIAVIACNGLLAATLLARRGRSVPLAALILAAGLGAAALMARGSAPAASGEVLRVAVVQPNIPSFRLLMADPARRAAHQHEVLTLVRAAAAVVPPPDLIAVPEYPSLMAYFANEADRRLADRAAAEAGIPLLLTAFRDLPAGGTTSASVLVHGDGSFAFTDKQVLFPFGEYLPGERLAPWLRGLFPVAGRLVPGEPPAPLMLPRRGVALAVLMCFDDTAGGPAARILRSLPQDRPALAISLVNDEAFGNPRARDLHLLMARYRAIESGHPLLRVTNDGHSGVIGADGRLVRDTRLPQGTVAWRVLDLTGRSIGGLRAADVDAALRLAALLLSCATILACLAMRRDRRRQGGRP